MFKETASGASANRAARNQILDLAQARQIDAILVSELSRWGRSTQDLLDTLNRLAGWKVSVVAMNGMTFELDVSVGWSSPVSDFGHLPFGSCWTTGSEFLHGDYI